MRIPCQYPRGDYTGSVFAIKAALQLLVVPYAPIGNVLQEDFTDSYSDSVVEPSRGSIPFTRFTHIQATARRVK